MRHIIYSRLKLNTRVYIKNPTPDNTSKNGALKKQTAYLQLNTAEILHQLKSGETIEILEAYISHKQKLPSSCHPSSFDRKTNPNTVTQSNDL